MMKINILRYQKFYYQMGLIFAFWLGKTDGTTLYSTQWSGEQPILCKNSKSNKNKIKFYQLLIKHGLNINEIQRSDKIGGIDILSIDCMIFQIMDYCYISSKAHVLNNLIEQMDVQYSKKQREKQLYAQFNQENPPQQYQFRLTNTLNFHQHSLIQHKPDCSLIIQLLKMGVDPNSRRSTSFKSIRYDIGAKDGEQFAQQKSVLQQTFLHRAIMNNQLELVEILLKIGAVQKNYIITIKTPLYPSQWCEIFKEHKKQSNVKQIIESQNNINMYQQKLKTCQELGQQRQLKLLIRMEQFSIFKAQRFAIQNQTPDVQNKNVRLSCLDIAHKFKVNQKIIQLLMNNNNVQDNITQIDKQSSSQFLFDIFNQQ